MTKEDKNPSAKQPESAPKDQPKVENPDATTADDMTKQEKQLVELATQVQSLTAELEEAKDKLLRSQAEIANIQQRQQKEQSDLLKYSGQQLAHDFLPAMDNLERALDVAVDDEAGENLKKGVQMVFDHLIDALAQNGIEEIPAVGEKFDPTKHQAVQTVPADDDHPAEQVVTVLQKGYMLKDRVLRPAMVSVAQ